MIDNKMIEVLQDLNSISYDTGIEIKIIPNNFDCTEKFTKLTSSQFNFISMADSSLNKEAILMTFLYINSYIGKRSKDGTKNAIDYPEAFFKSINNMSKELSMSKSTIEQCLKYLTHSTGTYDALLIKREVESIQFKKTKSAQNLPNIYVLNKEGYQQEIELALKRLASYTIR